MHAHKHFVYRTTVRFRIHRTTGRFPSCRASADATRREAWATPFRRSECAYECTPSQPKPSHGDRGSIHPWCQPQRLSPRVASVELQYNEAGNGHIDGKRSQQLGNGHTMLGNGHNIWETATTCWETLTTSGKRSHHVGKRSQQVGNGLNTLGNAHNMHDNYA
jgi:hypothetical protein